MAQSEEAKLKAAVTRTRNRAESFRQAYGAHDIPESHPLAAKAKTADVKAREARQSLMTYQRGQ